MRFGFVLVTGVALVTGFAAQTRGDISAQFDFFGPGGSTFREPFYLNYRIMQTFVAEKTGTLSFVDVTIHKTDSSVTNGLTAKIFALRVDALNGYQPTGAPLATGTLSASDPQFNTYFITWKRFAMSPMQLTPGQHYGLVVDAGFTGDGQYDWYSRFGSDFYTDGYLSIDISGTFAQQIYDVPFRIIVDEFTLTTSAENGTISKDPNAASYATGAVVTLTATPNTGFHFTGWSGAVTGTNNPETVAIFGHTSVTGAFAMNVVTLLTDTASASVPEGGTTTFQVKLSAQPVSNTTVTVAPTAGDADITVSDGTNLTFTTDNWDAYQTVTLSAAEDDSDNVNGAATITCSGEGLIAAIVTATEVDDDFTLTATAVNGQVLQDPNTPYYDNGSTVTLTAVPDLSYVFLNFSGDLISTDNPALLVMDSNKNVTANFGAISPVALPPSRIAPRQFTARWSWVEDGAPEGELSVATDALFTQPVAGYDARYVVNNTGCLVTNLLSDRYYWYRVRRTTPTGDSPWSNAMKVRTGKDVPCFTRLLSAAPVSKGIRQVFALSDLATGAGALTVKSSNPNAVAATLSDSLLTLDYLWKATNAATVTLTLKQDVTGYKVSYPIALSRAPGSLALAGQTALTNAGTRAALELTLQNQTGETVYGIRVRANGLGNPGWLINRTGLDPATGVAIRDIPCVLPAGTQVVVRLVFNSLYKAQAKTTPAVFKAFAILPPLNGTPPVSNNMAIPAEGPYDGAWLLGLPANRSRLYRVYQSDNDGTTWTQSGPAIQATANYLMWLDIDEGAPADRIYRVEDAGM